MLIFKDYLTESNPLWKNVEQPLSQEKRVGVVSAIRYDRSPKGNKASHKALGHDLRRLGSHKQISGYKVARGRYQDTAKALGDVDKEASYVVRQGEGCSSKHFTRIIDALGKRYGQQSTMHIMPSKEAEYHYLGGNQEIEKKGKVIYNRKLVKGKGDTSFAGKQSFTTEK